MQQAEKSKPFDTNAQSWMGKLQPAIEPVARQRNVLPEQVVDEVLARLEQPKLHDAFPVAELRHRIKNELHFLAAAMRIRQRSEGCTDDVACKACIGQVTALSHLNDALDDETMCRNADLGAQCLGFADALRTAFHLDNDTRHLSIKADTLIVTSKVARNMLLILNEVVTNAVKHAFDSTGGCIRVTLRHCSGTHGQLVVKDDGKGPFLRHHTGKGQTLMQTLATEIAAEIQRKHGPSGCRLTCTFPLAPSPPARAEQGSRSSAV